MKTSTECFSDRVHNYVRCRPGYPRVLIDVLIENCRLDASSVIAGVGSGTGIFTRQLLEGDLRVIGVEPNREMRLAAEPILADFKTFASIAGSAEATTLPAFRDVLEKHVFPLGSWRANSPSRSRAIGHDQRPDIREQSNPIVNIGMLANEEESLYAEIMDYSAALPPPGADRCARSWLKASSRLIEGS